MRLTHVLSMREPRAVYPDETVVTPQPDVLRARSHLFRTPAGEGNLSSMSANADSGRAGFRNGATVREAHAALSRPRAPGILLGIGLGGFVDGIVLHQILQWHHMLTSEGSYPDTTVAGLEANTLWDGLFHAATWVAVAVGLYILWRRATDWRWAISGHALLGWMLVGWGVFNLVEGIVDHHILTIHHVREGSNQTAWDLAFLAFGALLLLGGWALTRAAKNSDLP